MPRDHLVRKIGEHRRSFGYDELMTLAERVIGPAKVVELLQRPLADIERAMKGPANPHARRHQ